MRVCVSERENVAKRETNIAELLCSSPRETERPATKAGRHERSI